MKIILATLILSNCLLFAPSAPAQTTSLSAPSDPALRQELLDRFKHFVTDAEQANSECSKSYILCHGLVNRLEKTIEFNAERLKAIARQHGWPSADFVGLDGEEAALSIVLNSGLPFKKEMLSVVQRAYRAGKTQGSVYARLLDNVLVAEGKPQVYGTQVRMEGEAIMGLHPIQDEGGVDKRRAEVGLPTLGDYIEELKKSGMQKKSDKQ